MYDGQWDPSISINDNGISIDDKIKMFNSLIDDMKVITGSDENSSGICGLRLIISDIQKEGNNDTANNIYADDILAQISIKLDIMKMTEMTSEFEIRRNSEKNEGKEITSSVYEDTICDIFEQMGDMYMLGRCPQGRTTRLIQIHNYL
jgi:hypothetical protein